MATHGDRGVRHPRNVRPLEGHHPPGARGHPPGAVDHRVEVAAGAGSGVGHRRGDRVERRHLHRGVQRRHAHRHPVGSGDGAAQGYGTPASVVLNPADLAAIDISIMGSTMGGPQLNNSVWGLNFIPASGVAVGTAYVGDLGSAVQLFRRANAADLPHRQPRRVLHQQHRADPRRDPGDGCGERAGGAGGSDRDRLMAATVAEVRVHLGLDPATTVDEEALAAGGCCRPTTLVAHLPPGARPRWTRGRVRRPTRRRSSRRRGCTGGGVRRRGSPLSPTSACRCSPGSTRRCG